MTETRKCTVCGTEFEKGRTRAKVFCSKECYKEGKRRKDRIRNANKHMDYDFELDMKTWEWTKK